MSKVRQLAKGAQFAMIPRDVMESPAWRSLSINARRFIDFLQLEHMRHGGRENGNLKAPYKQLKVFGIAEHYRAQAIRDTEEAGFVDVRRGGQRVANLYALTWLPLKNGTPASNLWRRQDDPENQKSECQSALSPTC
jgi:hypothetical protein